MIQQDIAEKAQSAQININNLNIAQAETQRFNDLFFELLHRYQSLSEELTEAFSKDDGRVIVNYFDSAMEDVMAQFKPLESYSRSVTRAQRLYTEFYLANATHLAPLFRTLYRIMELTDSANISTKEKLRYAKIIRAQFRESELFFLRYNCMTSYGDNFIEYINMYRLTKHLPIMSLLEFKYIKDKFGDDEVISLTLNMVFRNVWRKIYGVSVGKIERSNNIRVNPSSGKYELTLDMSSSSKTILNLSIDNVTRNREPLLSSLSKLNQGDLQLLMKYFLLEVYKYSNFSKYNDIEGAQLKFETGINLVGGKTIIYAIAKSNINLRLSHPKWDVEYGIMA
ncbi:MAG: putative phage abortive infection protein [Muribaculum sp.]|nr:putative phage abortive infection protein [Muribaculum sp.]